MYALLEPRQARIAPGEIIYHALTAPLQSHIPASLLHSFEASSHRRLIPALTLRIIIDYCYYIETGPVIPTGLRVGPGQLLARVKELGDMRSYRSIHLKP